MCVRVYVSSDPHPSSWASFSASWYSLLVENRVVCLFAPATDFPPTVSLVNVYVCMRVSGWISGWRVRDRDRWIAAPKSPVHQNKSPCVLETRSKKRVHRNTPFLSHLVVTFCRGMPSQSNAAHTHYGFGFPPNPPIKSGPPLHHTPYSVCACALPFLLSLRAHSLTDALANRYPHTGRVCVCRRAGTVCV